MTKDQVKRLLPVGTGIRTVWHRNPTAPTIGVQRMVKKLRRDGVVLSHLDGSQPSLPMPYEALVFNEDSKLLTVFYNDEEVSRYEVSQIGRAEKADPGA